MTKVSPEIGEQMTMETILPVSVDVSFPFDHFPRYKLGPDNQVLEEPKEGNKGPSLKEIAEQEIAQLSDQHKRLSVRDLATKFDKNLASAAKLAQEAKIREVASLEGHVLLKKLRDALESLRGRMAGRNKEDVEKTISMVEALAVKLTQKEGELIQEKFEVKKLANFLRQASSIAFLFDKLFFLCNINMFFCTTSEDAKKLVSQERSFACAEIESARVVVQRFGEALEEEERNAQTSKDVAPDLEVLLEEIQEARRIKMLHHPSKVMDMEHELRALRAQIREKAIFSVKLQNQLAISRRVEDNKSAIYRIEGAEHLGSCLRLHPRLNDAPQLSKCLIQWYRVSTEGSHNEVILGAEKTIYAPEPFDVGRVLQVDIVSNGQKVSVTTAGHIEPAPGLMSRVEALLRKSSAEFSVTISQINGQDNSSQSVHSFSVGKTRIKLSRGWITKGRDIYSASMKLCGARTISSIAAAKSLFWQPRKGLSFVLKFETEQERNAAIMIARRFSLDCNVILAGPDDQV
ncbi:Stomatal closure-related actin-binding protein 3 [Linum perenne]